MELFDDWAEIDRSHRKLAHRGSLLGWCSCPNSAFYREFMALHALAMHVGRPGTPTDQAHIESFFGHGKHDWPHLEHVRDPGVLAAELEAVRLENNSGEAPCRDRLRHPDDEPQRRGAQIRNARHEGMRKARVERIAYRRSHPSVRA